MRIGLVQYSPDWEQTEENIAKVESIIEQNYNDEDLLIFPEMTLTGFSMESEKFAEGLDGAGTKYFISLAQKLKKHIFAGIIERDNDKIYNSLVHFDNNGLVTARYRKIHPFSYAKEDKYYTAAKEVVITKIDHTEIGLSICYDLRFPELYRFYGKKETDIIINIANWPVKRIKHWNLLLKARAVENQCYMIGVNRVGSDPFNEYNGSSAVIDPMGEEVLVAENKEGIFSVEIDLKSVIETRKHLPFLQDIKLI